MRRNSLSKSTRLIPELVYQKSANKDREKKESGNSEHLVWRGGHWRRECFAECRLPHKSLNGSVFFPSVKPLKPRHQSIRSSCLIYDPLCQPLLSTNYGGGGYEIFRIWKRQLFVFECRQVCASVRMCPRACFHLCIRRVRVLTRKGCSVPEVAGPSQHPQNLLLLSEIKIKELKMWLS